MSFDFSKYYKKREQKAEDEWVVIGIVFGLCLLGFVIWAVRG